MLHTNNFGWISLLFSIALSLILLVIFQRRSSRFLVLKGRSRNISLALFLLILISGTFTLIPLILSASCNFILYWLHEILRGTSYASSGFESAYEFGTQLLALGCIEALWCISFIASIFSKNIHSKNLQEEA